MAMIGDQDVSSTYINPWWNPYQPYTTPYYTTPNYTYTDNTALIEAVERLTDEVQELRREVRGVRKPIVRRRRRV